MKNIFLYIIGILIVVCCAPKQETTSSPTPTFTEADLRSNWEQLVYDSGKWMMPRFCEADNFNIKWKGDTMLVNYGQEAEEFIISKISGENGTFLLESAVNPTRTLLKYRVEPIDTMPGVVGWYFPKADGPTIMVNFSARKNYYEQVVDCKGYFEEEDK